MKAIETSRKNMVLYSVMIYVVFLILFAITGVISTFVTSNKAVLQICVTICSWTSFFVLMLMFKRLMPGMNRSEFIKGLFTEKINLKLTVIIIAVQLILFFAAVWCVAVIHTKKKAFLSMHLLINGRDIDYMKPISSKMLQKSNHTGNLIYLYNSEMT